MDRKQKSFLEKYKDTFGGLVDMLTCLGIVFAALTAFFQYVYSVNAADFYQVERALFQENLALTLRLFWNAIVHILWFMLPWIPLWVIRIYCSTLRTDASKDVIILVAFLISIVLFSLDYILTRIFVFKFFDEAIQRFYSQGVALFLSLGIFICSFIVYAIIVYFILKHKNKKDEVKVRDVLAYELKHSILTVLIICTISFTFNSIINSFFGSFLYHYELKSSYKTENFFLVIFRSLGFWLGQYFFFNQKEDGEIPKRQYAAVFIFILSELIVFCELGNILGENLNILNLSQKNSYEIVQKMSSSNLEEQVTQKTVDCDCQEKQKFTGESFQVVILHRGSQVLLMNGKIDGKETVNPHEDITSSSNLEIDTSSYEFQEASQYRFYRKEFKNVTTNAPENNDKQGE